MKIHLYKAFTSNPEEGNPAGVVFDADGISKEDMIKIAAELGYSESVFIVKPTIDVDYRFRFMTPTTEVDACGHATLAASQAIYDIKPFSEIIIETNAGIVKVTKEDSGVLMMKMAKAEIDETVYEKSEIAKLLKISEDKILDLPITTASVGSPKLMIPISDLATVKNIKPGFDAMIEFCKDNPVKGFYAFTREVINKASNFHARQFNPAAGIPEDPITGIAGGALGLYARKHNLIKSDHIIIEQGYEMNKPGQIFVQLKDGDVFVGGFAVKFIVPFGRQGENLMTKFNSTNKLYDKYSKQFADKFERIPELEQLDEFIAMVKPKGEVLDLGSGSGRDSDYLAKHDLKVTGVDISSGLVAEAQKRHPGIKFEVKDILNLDFEENSFDGIWCKLVILHLDRTDIPKLFQTIFSILKPGGVFFLETKAGKGEGWEEVSFNKEEKRLFVYYELEELRELLQEAGFSKVEGYHYNANKYHATIVQDRVVVYGQKLQ